jgi:hypothetical protein
LFSNKKKYEESIVVLIYLAASNISLKRAKQKTPYIGSIVEGNLAKEWKLP